jgi:hypothetical protein
VRKSDEQFTLTLTRPGNLADKDRCGPKIEWSDVAGPIKGERSACETRTLGDQLTELEA